MADEMAENVTYANASLEADLVMKGGITSGIVYPHAACQLARRYRFRNVGGTSAGAIAAAATAAAEYARRTDNADGGYARLYDVPSELSEVDHHGATRLQSLFQPDPETRSLFELATVPMQRGTVRKIWTALHAFWLRAWPAMAIALALAVVFGLVLSPWAAGYPLLIGFVGALVGVALSLGSEARAVLPHNHFGLCRLGPAEGDPGSTPPLTVWLHSTIQELAGMSTNGKPLTFVDLWGADQARPGDVAKHESHPELRGINLEMVATDLTLGRPLRLPFLRDEHAGRLADGSDRLVVDLNEFRELFPKAVVDHLEKKATTPGPRSLELLRERAPEGEFRHLPSAELPIVIAARMSLAFPFLISAVPLWRLPAGSPGSSPRAERALISDGGITSNFPVHFFDSPLPRRPTFALDLTGFLGDEPDPDDGEGFLHGPESPRDSLPWEPLARMSTVGEFFVAIKDAMQNWRDNAQARMPGFRERVVHIHIGRHEGGLNLAMDKEKIDSLSGRGGAAGERLVTKFSGKVDDPVQQTEHWNDTRFARYRIAMQGTEQHLRSFGRGWRERPDDSAIPYPERVAAGLRSNPYRLEESELLRLAAETTDRYLEIADYWEDSGGTLSDRNSPRPPAVLRTAPGA
jgi:predicted acylesterase/phospholipase RssA